MNETDKFDLFFFEEHYHEGDCRFSVGDSRVSMFEWDDSYSIQTEPANPDMVCTLRRYFADTLTLSEEGQYLKHGGVRIGIWKTYDRLGNLVETIDHEAGWGISWDGLQPSLAEMLIKLEDIQDIERFDKSEIEFEDEEEEDEENEDEQPEENAFDNEEQEDDNDEFEDEEDDEEDDDADSNSTPTPFKFGPKNEKQQEDEDDGLDHCWVITTKADIRSSLVFFFDGNNGEFLKIKVQKYK